MSKNQDALRLGNTVREFQMGTGNCPPCDTNEVTRVSPNTQATAACRLHQSPLETEVELSAEPIVVAKLGWAEAEMYAICATYCIVGLPRNNTPPLAKIQSHESGKLGETRFQSWL